MTHAYMIDSLTTELERQPIPATASDIEAEVRMLALSIGRIADRLYALDYEVGDTLGTSLAHIRDQFNDLALDYTPNLPD